VLSPYSFKIEHMRPLEEAFLLRQPQSLMLGACIVGSYLVSRRVSPPRPAKQSNPDSPIDESLLQDARRLGRPVAEYDRRSKPWRMRAETGRS